MPPRLPTAASLLLSLLFPLLNAAGDDILPFEPNDTLEEIRYKIDYNGYTFTVSDNRVFRMDPEEKSRFFSRRPAREPKGSTESDEIGTLVRHLGQQALPTSFDWRNVSDRSYIGPIRDQGDCGSCYAFGANAAAEGTYNWALGLYDENCFDFSESYIIWCLGRLPDYEEHFYGCGGADYDYMELEALTREGVILESDFPYRQTDPGSCAHWNDQTVAFQSWHRITCNDIEAIKTAIMTYGVVDAAVEAGSAFMAYSDGVYADTNTSCNATPCYNAASNHAIALVGWDDDPPEGGGGCWILRNSWGEDWGENGYMRICYTSAGVACAVSYLVYREPPTPTPTPAGPTPGPNPTCGPPLPRPESRIAGGDYDGDGRSDIAIFRPATGLWAVRGVTRAYFGTSDDLPVPGDYGGSGRDGSAFFRPTSGLWAVRGLTRAYFGRNGDFPVPADYGGDGTDRIAIFRPRSGLWAVRGITRTYFGRAGDIPVPADYSEDGAARIAVFRPATGLWAIRGMTRIYFGSGDDWPLPGDYGLGLASPAVFRPGSGLWAIRGMTRIYFGGCLDQPVPGGYSGAGFTGLGIFRPAACLWAIRGITRAYFGADGDIPATR